MQRDGGGPGTDLVRTGNVVALEAEGQFSGGVTLEGSVFLTFDSEGLIVNDRTYLSDPTGALSPSSNS